MVFVPRFLRPASFLPAALLLLAVATTGCENKHVGRACDVVPGPTQPTASTTAIINSAALECPSRICVLPAAQKAGAVSSGTGPTCSDECSSDSDCEDSEKAPSLPNGSRKDPTDKRCLGSYVCRVATNLGGFACRKLCLCNDFIDSSEAPGACVKAP